MNATANTNVNPVSKIIAAAMTSATADGNRQAALTVAMFASEVTFSADSIIRILEKEGKEKTEAMDALIVDLSEEFAAASDLYNRLADKDYRKTLDGAAKERNIFEADAVSRKLRAARKMFELAMKATYNLRVSKAVSVKTNNVGTGSLAVLMPTKEFPDHPSMQRVSNNALASAGDALVRERTGKSKKEPNRTANPNAINALADTSKALAAIAPRLREPVNGNGKVQGAGAETVFEKLDDETRNNIETVFRNVFAAKFFDGNVFDERSFFDWVNTTFKAEKEAAAKQNAGKQEKKADKAA